MNIRIANINDIEVLFELNELFNGEKCTTKELLLDSIANNKQETVFVAVVDDMTVGFCCMQVFKSMCYCSNYAEITELFIKEEYRRKGIAYGLMSYAESYYLSQKVKGFQLFTGKENKKAQAFYEKIGYKRTEELMYRKRF